MKKLSPADKNVSEPDPNSHSLSYNGKIAKLEIYPQNLDLNIYKNNLTNLILVLIKWICAQI
jgi:hypothetical protein